MGVVFFRAHANGSTANRCSQQTALVRATGGRIENAFWFVAIAMGLSGIVPYRWGEETHPRLNPAH